MMEKDLCDFIEEASRASGMAAKGLRPGGAPMSNRAIMRSLQESVNRMNELVANMRSSVIKQPEGDEG